MSLWLNVNDLAVASLVVRWTALLALAWIGHQALAGRNPRWRVAVWRAAVVGVAAIGILTLAPPVLTVPVNSPASSGMVPSNLTPSTPGPRDPAAGSPAPISRRQDDAIAAVAAPAPAETPVARRLVPALLGLWAVGIAVLSARLTLAWFALGRIIGRSDQAPGVVVRQARAVAEAIGAPAVRVVCSAEMATPCLAGLTRPVLLLPAVAMVDDDDMRAALAHELAHARGHDLAWNLAAHFATILLWFHPLAWRLRSAHAAACDAVCDAVAADFLGDVSTYARTLARLTLGAFAPPPEPGLAMARSAGIRERVDALNRKVFRSPLPRRLALPALVGVAALMILIGGLAVTDAGPRANATQSVKASSDGAPAVADADGRLEIQAVVAATGKPLEDAEVVWELRINNGRFEKTADATGADGRAVLEWPKGATVNGLQITARKAGFVPYTIRWDDRNHPLRPPAAKVLRLMPGTTIGGVVNDENKKPLARAKIRVHAPPAESDVSYYRITLAETTTDAQGRWRVDDAPADLSRLSISVHAPRFLEGSAPPSRNLNAVTVLKRGFTVKGRVIDPQGKPVAGAIVSGGENWGSGLTTTTDTRGDFALENCRPGASAVTVRANDFAPDLREIHPEDQPTLEFRLAPGHTLRGRIVDRQGKPVTGATIAANTWRAHRSLRFRVDSRADGRFERRGAPADVVSYDVFEEGFMSRRRVELSPSDAEQTITLDPELIISGRVIDASTRKPVPVFHVVQGIASSDGAHVSWLTQDKARFTEGRFQVWHTEPRPGYAVRVEAVGYKPADSRVIKPGETTPSLDFELTRAAPSELLSGTVVRPDGEPAAGVEVALATPNHPLLFEMSEVKFGRNNGMSFATTGPDGRFTFNAPDGPFLLAAMSDDGYAQSRAKFAKLTLQPWGKVKGQAFIGRQPAANETISVSERYYQPEPSDVHTFYNISTRTDAEGRFVFERVIPRASTVARVVITEFGDGSAQHMGCWQQPADIEPGQTVEVRIGGTGRAVVGRLVLKAAPGVDVDWRTNRPAIIERARGFNPLQNFLREDHHLNDRFAASLDKDGRFRVDDVPPGHYELTVTIDAPRANGQPGAGGDLGRVKVPVDVPEANDDVPVDLGEIAAAVKGQ